MSATPVTKISLRLPKGSGLLFQSGLPTLEEVAKLPDPLIIINLSHTPRQELMIDSTNLGFMQLTEKKNLRGVFEYVIDDYKTGVMDDLEYITLVKTIKLYLTSGISVLVNCAQGVSRSSYLICGVIISNEKESFNNAYNYLMEIRPVVCMNGYFRDHLKRIESKLINA